MVSNRGGIVAHSSAGVHPPVIMYQMSSNASMAPLTGRPRDLPLPSERHFGLFLTMLLLATAGIGGYRGWPVRVLTILIILSLVSGLTAFFLPHFLAPLNRAWFRLGLLLGRLVNPLVLAILFFGLITPIALLARLFGRDELRLRFRAADSYWIPRETARPEAESFTQQF